MADEQLEETIKVVSKTNDTIVSKKNGKSMPKLAIVGDNGTTYSRIGADIPEVNNGDDVVMRYTLNQGKWPTIVEVVKNGVAYGKAAPRMFGSSPANPKPTLMVAATLIVIHNKLHPDKQVTEADIKAIENIAADLVAASA